MRKSKFFILCALMVTALLHTSFAANETTNNNDTLTRQPRYSRLEAPILLIRPVTKESTTLRRLPINRKSNPIPMAPLMGNGFVIRTKTDDGDDDESVVKQFISHFGKVVTRIDHSNSKNTQQLNMQQISLPPNVNYVIKNIQNVQPKKRFSSQPNFVYRHPPPMVVHHRPAGFLKKRNIRTETLQPPQFRASPQIPFVESSSLLRPLFESSSTSDDWTPKPSFASPTLMHATENKQYQNQLVIKSQKEKLAYTKHLMERPTQNTFNSDDILSKSKPSQISFSSMTVALDDDDGDEIPSFKQKVSLRVAADEKIKNRTRLKPVREYQDEARKLKKDRESDQNSEENVQINYESKTPAPIFVTPIEVTTTKTTKLFKHRFSPKLNDSCEITCLMNIINLDYDPLCGSNDQTYLNVGKFRCAKICGQLQLTIKHFGNCEDKQSETK